MLGFKDVHDDPGFDLWDDTTTLYVQLLTGHVPPPETGELGELHPVGDAGVAGAGVLRIKPLDFAKQMTTFRTTGPGGRGGGVAHSGDCSSGSCGTPTRRWPLGEE